MEQQAAIVSGSNGQLEGGSRGSNSVNDLRSQQAKDEILMSDILEEEENVKEK